jgi:diguanylate cyclase (GGDEF)-like protein
VRGKLPLQSAEGAGSVERATPAVAPQERQALVDALTTSLAQSQVGIAMYDQHDRLQFANDEFRRAFAVLADTYPTWEDIIRRCHAERVGLAIHTDDIDAWLADVRTRRGVMRQRGFECDMVDGGWYRMNETMTADDWMLCVAIDITALKSNERVLRTARDNAIRTSQIDELTGCFNRRFIFAQFDDLLGRQASELAPISVAVLDLDHFKSINDSYGHQVGDEMLKHFCDHARANLRPQDWLGRTGGEEFLLLLPDTSTEDAVGIVARLRAKLTAKPMKIGTLEVACRFCAGVAQANKGESVSDIYRRADQALYKAKQSGRNQDVVASFAVAEPPAKRLARKR